MISAFHPLRLLPALLLSLVPFALSAQEPGTIDQKTFVARLPRAMSASSGEAHGVMRSGGLLVGLVGGAISADHYYSPSGELKRFDTSGTSYSRIFLRPSARYGLLDGVEVSLALPLTYERLTSTERFPERSISRLGSVDVGAGAELLQLFSSSSSSEGTTTVQTASSVSLALHGRLSIPTGFHNGIYNDPEHPSFFDDGALEGELGVAALYVTPEVQLGLKAGYRLRAEELENEIPWSLGVDLTRIEGAAIGVGAFGVFSAVDPSQPAQPFYTGSSGTAEQQMQIDGGRGILRRPDRENYVGIRAGATVDLGDTWSLEAQYAVRLAGTNSFGLSGAWMTLGYRMP